MNWFEKLNKIVAAKDALNRNYRGYNMDAKSMFMSLGKNDLVKGIVMAALGAFTGGIYTALQAGAITVAVVQASAVTGASAGLAYLMKNFFTNSNGEMLKGESK